MVALMICKSLLGSGFFYYCFYLFNFNYVKENKLSTDKIRYFAVLARPLLGLANTAKCFLMVTRRQPSLTEQRRYGLRLLLSDHKLELGIK